MQCKIYLGHHLGQFKIAILNCPRWCPIYWKWMGNNIEQRNSNGYITNDFGVKLFKNKPSMRSLWNVQKMIYYNVGLMIFEEISCSHTIQSSPCLLHLHARSPVLCFVDSFSIDHGVFICRLLRWCQGLCRWITLPSQQPRPMWNTCCKIVDLITNEFRHQGSE